MRLTYADNILKYKDITLLDSDLIGYWTLFPALQYTH